MIISESFSLVSQDGIHHIIGEDESIIVGSTGKLLGFNIPHIVVGEDVEIITDEGNILLEAGDIIILEALVADHMIKHLTQVFGIKNIMSPKQYWDIRQKIGGYLRKEIGKIRRSMETAKPQEVKQKERTIDFIKKFLDVYLDQWLDSLTPPDVSMKINAEKIAALRSAADTPVHKKESIKIDGETAKQFVDRLHKEKAGFKKKFEQA